MLKIKKQSKKRTAKERIYSKEHKNGFITRKDNHCFLRLANYHLHWLLRKEKKLWEIIGLIFIEQIWNLIEKKTALFGEDKTVLSP